MPTLAQLKRMKKKRRDRTRIMYGAPTPRRMTEKERDEQLKKMGIDLEAVEKAKQERQKKPTADEVLKDSLLWFISSLEGR